MGFQDARKKCIFYSGYACSVATPEMEVTAATAATADDEVGQKPGLGSLKK